MPRPLCRLEALGILNALGSGSDEVRARLLAGEPSRIAARDDLVQGLRLHVGSVSAALPPIPSRLRPYDCRNNALALAALQQIEEPLRACCASVAPSASAS